MSLRGELMDFGQRLKHIREKNNLTREDLASKLNVSYSTVSKYETNTRFPDQEVLGKIADLFKVTTDYLLGRSNIPNPYVDEDSISKEISNLSPESQEDLEAYIKLLKLRDMQKRNSNSSDELATLD